MTGSASVVKIHKLSKTYNAYAIIGRQAHELRNEVVEELIPDLMSKGHAELDVERVRVAETEGWRAKRAEAEENRGTAREKGHEAPLREASLSEKREPASCQDDIKSPPNRARRQSFLGHQTV
jgi:hypothetical protein